MSSGRFPATPQIASSWAERHLVQAPLELHPPRSSVTLLPYFPDILLYFILYLPLYTVIAHTSLPNLRHPAGATAPPLFKCQKSTINLLRESDVVPAQALPLPKAGGDRNVLQPKGRGDHNVHRHQKSTFEVAKQFMKPIIFTKNPRPIISDEKYSKVDEIWKLAIQAQHRRRALAGAPVGTPSVCQLPSGPSLKIDLET